MDHFILYFITVFTCSFYGSYRPEIKFLYLSLSLYVTHVCDISPNFFKP